MSWFYTTVKYVYRPIFRTFFFVFSSCSHADKRVFLQNVCFPREQKFRKDLDVDLADLYDERWSSQLRVEIFTVTLQIKKKTTSSRVISREVIQKVFPEVVSIDCTILGLTRLSHDSNVNCNY